MSEEKTQVQNARKDLDILNKMKNLPGGLVIIPLVIAVVLATFVPQVFQIGGYVTALFYEGNACMMGFFLIVCGSMIDIKQVGMPLYKGVIMTGTKFLLGVIVGLIVGKICGPEGFRDACKTAQPIVTFFMTISIGAKTDIKTILTAGASGIVLGLISAATAVIFFFVINLLLPKKERNAMGAAIGTTALNSAMTPAAVAEADPSMEGMVSMATAQCATASIITLFLCPFITAAFDKWMQKRQKGIYSPEGWAYDKVKAN